MPVAPLKGAFAVFQVAESAGHRNAQHLDSGWCGGDQYVFHAEVYPNDGAGRWMGGCGLLEVGQQRYLPPAAAVGDRRLSDPGAALLHQPAETNGGLVDVQGAEPRQGDVVPIRLNPDGAGGVGARHGGAARLEAGKP